MKMLILKILILATVVLLLATLVQMHGNNAAVPTPGISDADPLSQTLDRIRLKHQFPALTAAVIVDGEIVATSAVGFRKQGADDQVTADDKFHIGSITKSMTATIAAMLVEQGKISWTTTIGESFPELEDRIHAGYSAVTLEQLLAHRGGAPGSPPPLLWAKAWSATGTPAEQRMSFAEGILARKPEATPGTKHIYSNAGYTIAGVMLERAAGETWENLMQTMLFESLGMTTAGFGAPATLKKTDQPWGHTKKALFGIDPVAPGPRADNPAAIGPAGTVHCSTGDLAKYAAFHLAGARGENSALKPETFRKLHTPADDDNYALGWVVLERGWAGGTAFMHNGSNTMFYALLWIAPERNFAAVATTNFGGDGAFAGCNEAIEEIIREFLEK